MQPTLVLWKAPESFSFFKKPSSSLPESAVDRGSQQAQHFGQPLVQKGMGNGIRNGALQSWSPRAWSPAPPGGTSEASTQTELLREDTVFWVWGCWGAWVPLLRLGQREVGSLLAPGSWALVEGLRRQVKDLQEISSLGSVRDEESKKLSLFPGNQHVWVPLSSACAAWGTNRRN